MAGDNADNGDEDADDFDPEKPWESRAFKEWWEADYSWEGLAAKRQGPDDSDSPTLQDYWHEQKITEDDLIEFAGRKWTPFHLPLWDLDGNNSPKAEWNPEELKILHAGLKKLLHATRLPEAESGKVEGPDGQEDSGKDEDAKPPRDLPDAFIDGVFVPGDFDISSHELECRAHFTRAWITGKFRCNGTRFQGDVYGQLSVLQHGADFDGARFRGGAGFEGGRFEGGAFFEGARFEGEADFKGARFQFWAVFREARFEGGAFFRETRFQDVVFFHRARFQGGADFDGAHFQGGAFFHRARFHGGAGFDGAHFQGGAFFDTARFQGGAGFTGARFQGWAVFEGTRIQGQARCDAAEFLGPALFRNSVITGSIYFNRCRFHSWSNFSADLELDESDSSPPKNWRFMRAGSFDGSVFKGHASFINRRFGSGVGFRKTEFFGRARFEGATLHPDMTFHGARFRRHRGRVDWPSPKKSKKQNAPLRSRIENLAILLIWPFLLLWHAFQLYWPFFLRRPSEWFRFSLIPVRPFRRSFVRQRVDAGTEDLERDYRTLKLAMEENRSRTEEALFFGHELSARLNRCDVPLLERLFLILYWLVSDFGRSLTRSLAWLAAWQPAMVFTYAAFENGWRLPPLSELWDARIWQFAVQQTTRPFSVWSEFYKRYAADWAKPYFCHPEFTAAGGTCKDGLLTLQMIGTVHSLGALVLLFLFLVVLRRRFQMN